MNAERTSIRICATRSASPAIEARSAIGKATCRQRRSARMYPVQRLFRSPLPRLYRRSIEGNCRTDERLECSCVYFVALMDVDRSPYISIEARIEKLRRVLQRSAFREGELHDRLVRLAGAHDPVVRPDGRPHPLPLFDDVRVGFPDELAHPAQRLASPICEIGDSFVAQLGGRKLLARIRLLHPSSDDRFTWRDKRPPPGWQSEARAPDQAR